MTNKSDDDYEEYYQQMMDLINFNGGTYSSNGTAHGGYYFTAGSTSTSASSDNDHSAPPKANNGLDMVAAIVAETECEIETVSDQYMHDHSLRERIIRNIYAEAYMKIVEVILMRYDIP